MQSLEEQINELIMISGNTLSTAQEIIELVLKTKETINQNKTTFTLDELKKVTAKYDERMGRYPESRYEGQSFYEWLIVVNECDWFLDIFKEEV